MSIAIIGSGYIGRAIASALVCEADNITLISRSPSEEIAGVSNLILPELGALGSTHLLAEVISEVDIVINAAWVNYRAVHSGHNVFENLPFQMELIDYILKSDKRLINLGSAFEYGLVNGPISESTECKPVTAYGVVKNILRIYAFERAKFSDGNVLWLRIFNVMGDPPAKGTFFYLLNEAIRNGKSVFKMSRGDQLRDYIDIRDLAELVVTINNKNLIGAFNIGSGNPRSMYDMACEYAHNQGSAIAFERGAFPIPDHETLGYWADISKLTNALDG